MKHEQGHFDLAEMLKKDYDKIIKNKFYDKVFPTRGQNDAQRKQFAKEDSGKMISIEIANLSQNLRKKRDEYNIETDFGKNIPNQTKYEEIFKKFKL